MATKEEIDAFLATARQYKASGRLDFIRGKEEKYTLGYLGISIRDAYSLIDYLTHENYYRGPSPDHRNREEFVWEFGIEEVPDDIYVKLKIRKDRNDLLMMSFHFAKRPIDYPYKSLV